MAEEFTGLTVKFGANTVEFESEDTPQGRKAFNLSPV